MPSLKDVAKKANVSPTTVSRVLNNRGYISQKTRDAVMSAMEELHYTPNELARNLFQNSSRIIALVIPDISHPFFSDLTKYTEECLYSYGYKLMLCNTTAQSNREREYLELFYQKRVEAIIMASHSLDIDYYNDVNANVVSVDRSLGNHIPTVASNHQKGGCLAAQKLISCGCKKVLQLIGSTLTTSPSFLRHVFFEQECRKHGLEVINIELSWNQFYLSNEDIENLFDSHPDVDGIFTTDLLVASFIRIAKKRHLSIPQDLKLVGYDDSNICRFLPYNLTTIHQPIQSLAENAVMLALKRIKNEPVNDVILDVHLVEGETT